MFNSVGYNTNKFNTPLVTAQGSGTTFVQVAPVSIPKKIRKHQIFKLVGIKLFLHKVSFKIIADIIKRNNNNFKIQANVLGKQLSKIQLQGKKLFTTRLDKRLSGQKRMIIKQSLNYNAEISKLFRNKYNFEGTKQFKKISQYATLGQSRLLTKTKKQINGELRFDNILEILDIFD